MRDDELKQICAKLKPRIGAKADALWLAYLTSESPELKREAEVFINLFATKFLTREVDDKRIFLPPPSRHIAEANKQILLGTVQYGDQSLYPIYLAKESIRNHLGIFGITGSGKSNAAMMLLLGLLKEQVPFFVLDWKRSYRSLLGLESTNPLVRKITVFTFGRKTAAAWNWNPLRGPPGTHPRTWLSALVESLEMSHLSGPGASQILIDALDKKFSDYGMFDGTFDPHNYPNFHDALQELVRLQMRGRQMLWQQSAQRILQNLTYGPSSGAFNSRNPIKLEDLLSQYVILELDREISAPLRIFATECILRWMHLHWLSQGEHDGLRHVLFLEEVHNLFPQTYQERAKVHNLEIAFREMRSFGAGVVALTQHPSLVPIYMLGNINTQIYLSLQHEEDIITAKRALFLETDDIPILDRLKVGEGIVKIKGRFDPCLVKFPLVPVRKGTIDDADLALLMDSQPAMDESKPDDGEMDDVKKGDVKTDDAKTDVDTVGNRGGT